MAHSQAQQTFLPFETQAYYLRFRLYATLENETPRETFKISASLVLLRDFGNFSAGVVLLSPVSTRTVVNDSLLISIFACIMSQHQATSKSNKQAQTCGK